LGLSDNGGVGSARGYRNSGKERKADVGGAMSLPSISRYPAESGPVLSRASFDRVMSRWVQSATTTTTLAITASNTTIPIKSFMRQVFYATLAGTGHTCQSV